MERRQHINFKDDAEYLLIAAELLFNKTNTTLRQQEKIFGQTRLVLKSFKSNQYTFSHVLFILIYIKIKENQFYQKIENNTLSIQELSDEFIKIIPLEIKNDYGVNLVYIVALLLYFYNNSQNSQNRIQIFKTDTEGNSITPIKINISNISDNELASFLNTIRQQSVYTDLSLKYLINKINLTESIIIN